MLEKCLKYLFVLFITVCLGTYESYAGGGTTYTWTGDTDTDWNTVSNWNPVSLPTSTDDVVIPTSPSGGNMPTINSGSFTIKSLTIESGATLTQTNGTLLVKGDQISISGTYNQTGGILLTDKTATVNTGGSLNIIGTFHLADKITKDPSDHLVVSGTINQTNGTLNVKNLTINTGGSYNSDGTTLDIFGDFNNYSNVYLNSGGVTLRDKINNLAGGSITIAGATVTSLGQNVVNKGSISISSGSLLIKKADGTGVDKKIQIDGGTFNQIGDIVSTKDLELKNDGTYNQSAGELQISHDLKVSTGNTFTATGGTVRWTGVAGSAADYTGSVQFYNVLIDVGADYNMNKNNDNIKIAGNFTNYNPNLDNDKGTVTFNGTSPQTIYSASTPLPDNTTFGNLVIDKPSGTIQLSSDVAVENTFIEINGTLDENGNSFWVNSSPLPVELSSFSTVILENGIKLKWRTETEVNNYGFEVQRSVKADNWEVLGFIEGHGNSNSPKEYNFIDSEVNSAGTYSYRLKQIDNDGKFEYSKVIEVNFGSPMNYELSQNYPNPFNPSTTIRFSVLESSFINLSIFNPLGEKIEELVNEVKEPGVHTIEFNAQDLPSGTYFYRINSDNYTHTKKMILAK